MVLVRHLVLLLWEDFQEMVEEQFGAQAITKEEMLMHGTSIMEDGIKFDEYLEDRESIHGTVIDLVQANQYFTFSIF